MTLKFKVGHIKFYNKILKSHELGLYISKKYNWTGDTDELYRWIRYRLNETEYEIGGSVQIYSNEMIEGYYNYKKEKRIK